jgi:hypothetical protein
MPQITYRATAKPMKVRPASLVEGNDIISADAKFTLRDMKIWLLHSEEWPNG